MALTKVQTNAIADDAVTTDKLANAINTARDANTAKVSLTDNSVTLAKMAGGTDGQIITYDASGDPVAVGPGTDGQVLTSTGAGSPPAFETLPTSGATLSGSTNNTVVTVTGANAMTGEANLTFDGNHLAQTVDASGEGFNQTASGNHSIINEADSNRSAANNDIRVDTAKWNGTAVTEIHHVSGADTSNKDDGYITFNTAAAGSTSEAMRIDSAGRVQINTTSAENADSMLTIAETSGHCEVNILAKNDSGAVLNFGDPEDYNIGRIKYEHDNNAFRFDTNNTEQVRIASDGNVAIKTGNIEIATSGKGIDFSATGDGNATDTSELFSDYEEGTWTPEFQNVSTPTYASRSARYTKIGRFVYCTAYIEFSNLDTTDTSAIQVGGLPYTGDAAQGSAHATIGQYNSIFDQADLEKFTNTHFGGTYIRFYQGHNTNLKYTDCNAIGIFQFALSYAA